MAGCAAFVLPSKPRPEFVETFGIALVEKMLAGGGPVITTDTGGIGEAVGDTALIVPVDSPSSIAAALDLAVTMPCRSGPTWPPGPAPTRCSSTGRVFDQLLERVDKAVTPGPAGSMADPPDWPCGERPTPAALRARVVQVSQPLRNGCMRAVDGRAAGHHRADRDRRAGPAARRPGRAGPVLLSWADRLPVLAGGQHRRPDLAGADRPSRHSAVVRYRPATDRRRTPRAEQDAALASDLGRLSPTHAPGSADSTRVGRRSDADLRACNENGCHATSVGARSLRGRRRAGRQRLRQAAPRAPRRRSQPLTIVAAFYPFQFVAERVAGTHGHVTSLTQPGAEPHDVELTPRQVATFSTPTWSSTSRTFQPAVDEAVAQSGETNALDTDHAWSRCRPRHRARSRHSDEWGARRGERARIPHVWLDPTQHGHHRRRRRRAAGRASIPATPPTTPANAASPGGRADHPRRGVRRGPGDLRADASSSPRTPPSATWPSGTG